MNLFDAIYARQSVDRIDSISTTSQIEFCKKEVTGQSFKVYTDKSYSGKNIDRPAFQEMLSDIKAGKVNRVIVYRLDRISRSVLDFANLIEVFQKNKVDFVSTMEKFDTSTPIGKAMLMIVMILHSLSVRPFSSVLSMLIHHEVNEAFIWAVEFRLGLSWLKRS